MRLYLSRSMAIALSAALFAGLAACSTDLVSAQDKVKPETVVVSLMNPFGVAVQPQTGLVFVSTRFGIYRYDPSPSNPTAHKAVVEIDGYPDPIDAYTPVPGQKYEIGPLGLAFMDKDHLIVGDGSRKTGEDLVRVYKIPPVAPTEWNREDAALHTLGPIKAGKDSEKGDGNFFGVAFGEGAIWVTCSGDDSKGWIAKAEVKEGKPGELKPTIATKPATEVEAPGPITWTPDRKELLVGQMGKSNADSGDSLLAFYDPSAGTLKRKLKAGLMDITGLAYSPKQGKLYATDAAWMKPQEGGLFELVVDGDSVKPTKLLKLDKPTALAFDKDGRLYVTVLGTPKDGVDKSKPGIDPGSLIVIKPGL